MRVGRTLPWPRTPASAWESPAVLGGGDTQFLFRKRVNLLPQLKETNLGSHYSEKVLHGKDSRTKEITYWPWPVTNDVGNSD